MSAHDDSQPLDPYAVEAPITTGKWIQNFLGHYWVMVFFGCIFVTMVSIPLILIGGMPLKALFIVTAFAIAITLAFVAPILMAPFMVLVIACVFGFTPEAGYNKAGWGLGTVFALLAAMGLPYFLKKSAPEEPLTGTTETLALPVALTAPVTVTPKIEEPKAAKGPKPIKFDKTIAAKGVTIIFGSESGNAEGLADVVKGKLVKDGHSVQVLDAAVVDARHLKAFANLLVLTSTWGEGDPPSNAIELVADLKNKTLGLSTTGIQFSVLSLGDTSYELFCQCGKDFDQYLEQYGGKRLFKRVDCDITYETPFEEWLTGVQGALKAGLNTTAEFVEEPVLVAV
ncbi:MAG: flavodoxin domain-containing protein [Vampirovibrionales bacterium]|nr:flavodoxin domain-containing protein [Vampirovibrionales bacterium]